MDNFLKQWLQYNMKQQFLSTILRSVLKLACLPQFFSSDLVQSHACLCLGHRSKLHVLKVGAMKMCASLWMYSLLVCIAFFSMSTVGYLYYRVMCCNFELQFCTEQVCGVPLKHQDHSRQVGLCLSLCHCLMLSLFRKLTYRHRSKPRYQCGQTTTHLRHWNIHNFPITFTF